MQRIHPCIVNEDGCDIKITLLIVFEEAREEVECICGGSSPQQAREVVPRCGMPDLHSDGWNSSCLHRRLL